MASGKLGTLYVGVTSNLERRIEEHRAGEGGFSGRYGTSRLVWYETHESMTAAIEREKKLKKYRRAWKVRIITMMNPEWADLAEEW